MVVSEMVKALLHHEGGLGARNPLSTLRQTLEHDLMGVDAANLKARRGLVENDVPLCLLPAAQRQRL